MRVMFQHLRTVPSRPSRTGKGYCRDKSKAWARAHGIDWRDFVRNGIEAETLEATGDAFALALVKHARECEARKQCVTRKAVVFDPAEAADQLLNAADSEAAILRIVGAKRDG